MKERHQTLKGEIELQYTEKFIEHNKSIVDMKDKIESYYVLFDDRFMYSYHNITTFITSFEYYNAIVAGRNIY